MRDSVPVPLTAELLLAPEAALAMRTIRSETIPRQFFRWLARPAVSPECPSDFVDDQIQQLMDQMIAPMLEGASRDECRETRNAGSWLAALSRCIADGCSRHDLESGYRLLAASLLPLYRCLATGRLREGFRMSRLRLSETLCLIALCDELGCDFPGMLERLQYKASLHATIRENLRLEIVDVAALARHHVSGFNEEDGQFTRQSESDLAAFQQNVAEQRLENWADPDLLWRLAGELVAKKTEVVLPRSWIEVPVPWSSIGEHWSELVHLLVSADPREKRLQQDTMYSEATLRDIGDGYMGDTARAAVSSDESPAAYSRRRDADSQSACILEHTEALREPDGRYRDRTDGSVQGTCDDEESVAIAASAAVMELDHPKIMIAQIHSHNDPAFANVLRRQIAGCRTQCRGLALASIVVEPEDESDLQEICGSLDSGMTSWQQKFVNWVAEHPHSVAPYCFLTSDGELILCLVDLERGEATSFLRHGLVEVLTGKRLDGASGSALAKVLVPARYHVGIASASSPGAGLTPAQLIEAACRCLAAAKSQGKASIKSIEVY